MKQSLLLKEMKLFLCCRGYLIFSIAAAAINNHTCLPSPVYMNVPEVDLDPPPPPDSSRDALLLLPGVPVLRLRMLLELVKQWTGVQVSA